MYIPRLANTSSHGSMVSNIYSAIRFLNDDLSGLRFYACQMGILGDNLRRYRKERGVSTWFLEKRTGIHRANLAAVELHGRSLSQEALVKLASVPELGISYDQLRAWQVLDKTTPEERIWIERELMAMKEAELF